MSARTITSGAKQDAQEAREWHERHRADLERPYFALQPSAPLPPAQGVQGDLIGARELDRKPR